MENFKLPAYPLPLVNNDEGEVRDATDWDGKNIGFTKLELASLMIAQGHVTNFNMGNGESTKEFLTAFSAKCVSIAKAVLEEANK